MHVKEIIAEVEWKSQGSRPWPRTKGHKTIRGQGPTLSRPRTGTLETKDQQHNAQVFSKKKVLLKFTARSLAHSPRRRKKKDHDLGPFFTNQKIVLFLTTNRAFSRTSRLGGKSQGLYYRGLQNVFSRTSSRTPPLKNSNAIQDEINIFFAKLQKNLYYLSLCYQVGCFQGKSHK